MNLFAGPSGRCHADGKIRVLGAVTFEANSKIKKVNQYNKIVANQYREEGIIDKTGEAADRGVRWGCAEVADVPEGAGCNALCLSI